LDLGIKMGLNVKNWFVIPNFVDTEKFCSKKNNKLRKKLNIPIDAFVVLSVGPLGFKGHKRMDWLIKEIKIAKSQINNLYLVIIGDVDKDTEDFINFGKKILGKNIIFIKNVPHDKISEYYNMADVFVLCSLSEPFGIVFLEAMSCEKPVIGHNFPVTKWIIGNGGITLDMKKEGDLANRIKKLCKSDKESFGKNGRERVKKLFAKQVVIPKFIEMYKSIINSSSV
jgi:glycosyltransferase involved in cell wall biosynthesis